MRFNIVEKLRLIAPVGVLYVFFERANTLLAQTTDSCASIDIKGGRVLDVFRRVTCKAGYVEDTYSSDSVIVLAGSIINIALSLTGVIFVILIIYGGFLWMTARGNETQVSESETLIRNSIIGIIITFSAFVISQFIVRGLSQVVYNT